MNVMEAQFKLNKKAPKCCSYCDEEKNFLMVKPNAFAVNGEVLLNVNHTTENLWMCLECLSGELDLMGLSVDIQEYD